MELAEIRREIDQLDDQMTALFLRRMAFSEQIAANKKQSGMPILDQAREDAIIARLTEGLDEMNAEAVRRLYERIFEISRQRQKDQ